MQTNGLDHKTNQPINEIIQNLYLGDIRAVIEPTILFKNNITAVISLLHKNEYSLFNEKNLLNIINKDNIYKIYINDYSTENIKKYFLPLCKIIEYYINNNLSIFIHCNKGISRSTTIILAYLLYKGYDSSYVYKFVKNKRSCIYPNYGFIQSLNLWNEELKKQKFSLFSCLSPKSQKSQKSDKFIDKNMLMIKTF